MKGTLAPLIAFLAFLPPAPAVASPAEDAMVGRPAPLASLEGILDAEGRPVDLSRLAAGPDGRGATLLVFWASWCHPCVNEIPVLNELMRVYGRRGLRVLGLGVREGGETLAGLKAAAAKHGAVYPVYYDSLGRAQETFGLRGVPMSALIDAAGVIRWIGPTLPGDVGARIERLVEPGERRGAK